MIPANPKSMFLANPFTWSGSFTRGLCCLCVALTVALAPSSVATATTYVMTTDRELVDRSDLVVLANVVAVSSAPETARPSTDYLIEIERMAKGFVPSSTLVVRALGGTRDDGLSMKVFGQPTLLEGDQVVLFLNPGEDGTYRFSDMGLSVFFVADLDERSYAFRALDGGANLLARPNDAFSSERALASEPRSLDGFLTWVSEAAADAASAPTPGFYVQTPLDGLASVQSSFTSFRSSTCGSASGSFIRRFEFESGSNVRYVADNNGQPGVPGNGLSDIGSVFPIWNGVSNTAISTRYAGTTTDLSPAITLPLDGQNSILFEDDNNEIPGEFTGSGTLAVGLVFFLCDVQAFAQGQAHAILESGIVFQDGTGANFFGISLAPLAALLEVLTHEVGHTLGFGHSCGDSSSGPCSGVANDAIMRAFAYDDGRGARINSDDRAGARFLYGVAAQGEPPAAPTALLATPDSTSQITLAWADQATDESSYEVEERSIGEEFALIATLGANSTALIVENLPEAAFREYRVRARNADGASDYSPIAGATTRGTIGQCVDGLEVLCLNNDRFEVTSTWATNVGGTGNGQREEITDDTGYFWFFQDTNVEVVVKVLDGCGINNLYWVFAGGLTDVQVVLLVIDRQTGLARTYINPQGTAYQPVQDTSAFATCP